MGSKKKKDRDEKDHLAPTDWMLGNALCDEEDRGCVLVACAKAERELTILLAKYFRKHGHASEKKIGQLVDSAGNPQALLGSGWAKANIALAIGIISPDIYSLFDGLRELRNDVAHHDGQIALTHKAVESFRSQLKDALNTAELNTWLDNNRNGKPLFGYPASKFSEPRITFMHACIYLIAALYECRIKIEPPGYPTGTFVASWLDGDKACMSFIPVMLHDQDSDPPQQ
jgi:hypothetical protein